MTLITQMAYQVWRDGRCRPSVGDTLINADLVVITAANLATCEAAGLLLRLATMLERRS